jgi:5'-methylthioadenosine phosphorylase
VVKNLLHNVEVAKEIVRRVVPTIAPARTCACASALKNAVITAPGALTPEARARLDLLIGKYFPAPAAGRGTGKGRRRG